MCRPLLEWTPLLLLIVSPLSWTWWSCLRVLILSFNKLAVEAIAALISVPVPSLESLELAHAGLNQAAAGVLAAGDWPQLARLNLAGNQLDNTSISFLAASSWPKLQCLLLHGNNFDCSGVGSLVNGKWPQLDHSSMDSGAMSAFSCILLSVTPALMPDLMNIPGHYKAQRDLSAVDVQGGIVWPKLNVIFVVPSLVLRNDSTGHITSWLPKILLVGVALTCLYKAKGLS